MIYVSKKQQLRTLDRKITRLDRHIRLYVPGFFTEPLAFLVANRAALDQRRREVRRELKVRPE